MTANPPHDADILLPFLEKVICAAVRASDSESEPVDVSGEARMLQARFESDAVRRVEQRIQSHVTENSGREPEGLEMDGLIRLAYLDSVVTFVSRRYVVRPRVLLNEIVQTGALGHDNCQVGERCPVCSRRPRVDPATLDDLRALAVELSMDPLHHLVAVNPDKVHAATIHWLASVGEVDQIWSSVGLNGPLPPPDASASEMGAQGTHLILDDGQGHWKAVIQCSFSACLSDEQVERFRERALKATRLRSPDLVKWFVYTLGQPATSPSPSLRYLTIDQIKAAIDGSPALGDPAAEAYSRYLGKLMAVRDCVLAIGSGAEFGFPQRLKRELQDLGVYKTCELSLQLTRQT